MTIHAGCHPVELVPVDVLVDVDVVFNPLVVPLPSEASVARAADVVDAVLVV